MATILKFEEAKLENAEGGTSAVVTSEIANVESEGGFTTIYFAPVNGVTYYLTLTTNELKKVQSPLNIDYVNEIYKQIVEGELLEDRREYSRGDLAAMYMLDQAEAETLYRLIQVNFGV